MSGNLRKLNIKIDDTEMMTHFLSNLPEACKNIVENLKMNLMTRTIP